MESTCKATSEVIASLEADSAILLGITENQTSLTALFCLLPLSGTDSACCGSSKLPEKEHTEAGGAKLILFPALHMHPLKTICRSVGVVVPLNYV